MADAAHAPASHADLALARVEDLLASMTLEEKAGQLHTIDASGPDPVGILKSEIAAGRIGAVINQVDPKTLRELQKIAVEDSRLGVPLLVSRDVIHGFNTIFPLPIGQACSWNPDLVRECARAAAGEAAESGIRWTFAPMVDISRDPRWGRIAESLGEDPLLASVLGAAMVEGFQGDGLNTPGTLAACVKHFAGYGASEGGRDYDATNIPDNELRNTYLPPFKAALKAGAASIMTSFGDIDGLPATGNGYLLGDILRGEWDFGGVVISDWDSIGQLMTHGLSEDLQGAALEAAEAGVDMDMMSAAFIDYLPQMVRDGVLDGARLDAMARRVLTMKAALGLFEDPYGEAHHGAGPSPEAALELARKAARESLVLLKNDAALPLDVDAVGRVAVIGPMADQPYEQMGTWVFDGDETRSVTPLSAFRSALGRERVAFAPGLYTTRSRDTSGFADAVKAVEASDAVVVCIGEEAILSGEAHCRADITLPGAQLDLLDALRATGKPITAVIMAGRPLTLGPVLERVDALIYAWHAGNMTGPALVDVISGQTNPAGKLPVSFPRSVGQIPIHYNRKNTGRPPEEERILHIDDIEVGASQTSFGMSAFHLDDGFTPQFPFGFGLSYTQFEYAELALSTQALSRGEALTVKATVTNTGDREGVEIVQLYIRDPHASLTRPVRELKGFQRVTLKAGESRVVEFTLTEADLAFSGRDRKVRAEAGAFDVWVGGDSTADLHAGFTLAD
jgi:beta-glucosidase